MIATGIFLFLLGTKLGRASDIQSNFVYEPSKIIVREEIDQSSFLIPELGPSPFLPNAVNQKSNYLLDKPFSMPGDVPAPKPVKIVTKIIEEERKNVTLRFNSNITNILIRERVPAYQNPVIDENEYTASQHSRLSLPIPDIALNVKPIPYLPSLSIPIVNSQLISQLPLPLQSLNIPGLPFLRSFKTSRAPIKIEEPLRTTDLIVSEMNVLVKKIPPPPELPPLKLKDIFKPIIIQEKKVTLNPFLPEIQAILPLSIYSRKAVPTY